MKRKHITPYIIIFLTFLTTILLGAILLVLPISMKNRSSMGFVNALFMSTSCVCVTGLSVYSDVASNLSIFGQVVMMLLIEIGGLSFLTIMTFIFYLLGLKIGISERYILKEALNQNSTSGILKLIYRTIIISIIIQTLGTLINLIVFIPIYGAKGIYISLFHAVSAFNNAGFDILGNGNSLISFSNNVLLNLNTMALIILGGLGFIVIYDLISFRKNKKLKLHTKIVLSVSTFLIVVGAILLKIAMPSITWLEAFFQSITARTAGFASVDMSRLNSAGTLIMIFLMFIGASPCSTGGGLKTTTFFVIIVYILSFAKGKSPRIGYRKISNQSLFKAFALVTFSIIYLCFAIFLISLCENDVGLKEITFESVSAFATVGLSMNLTPTLHIASKLILCATMFIGRLGPLTVISIMNNNWTRASKEEINYVEENIIIG